MKKNYFNFNNIILIFAFCNVFIFSSSLNSSFSLPKVLLLYIFVFYCVLYLLFFILPIYKIENIKIWILPVLFLSGFVILTIVSKNTHLALFGTYGRFTGLMFWFCVVFLMFITAITFENNRNLINMLILIGIFISLYGFMQYSGSGLVITSESYKVIGTLGNPNYVSTLIGVTSTLIFWKILQKQKAYIKLILICLLFLSLFMIIKSASAQGFFIFIICIASYLIGKILLTDKKVGAVFLSLFTIATVIGFFGLLQKGPLKGLLYQYSVSLRGDYWRTAINMFESEKLKGIGISRYGIEFQGFRDQTAGLRPSASITDDPHNEILYFLSSGGAILTLTYILVLILILSVSLFGLRKSNYHNHDQILILLSVWIGFRVESFISVNQVTNNIIEWIVAGTLIALSINLKSFKEVSLPASSGKSKNISLKTPAIISLVLIFTVVIIFPKLSADAAYAQYNRDLISGMNNQTLLEKKSLILEAINKSPDELIYRDAAVRFMINTNDFRKGSILVKSLIRIDPSYYSAYELEAIIFEAENNVDSAIKSRLKALSLDPYDLNNILSLRNLYLSVNNMSEFDRITNYLKNFGFALSK
jgi:O-antigen ligase